jgi:hypothetical protein
MASKKLLREWNINNQNSVINELDNRIKFIGRSSIRDIALEMSKELDTLNSVKVLKIRRNENSWEIYTDKNEIFYSSQLICTMPVPQIIELYKKSNLEIPSDIENNLTEVRYSRSIVGLLILEGKSVLKEEGGIEFSEGDIAFITDNNLKGVNNHGQALTIEMSDKFSRENWNLQDHELILKIIDSASDWLGSNVLQYQIHKWKYSRPLNSFPKKFEFIDHPGPVYLAGDAFMGNSAESAYLSGLSAAKCLLSGEKVKLNGAEV